MNTNTPSVLDACCGGKMFWFDREDTRALFVDKRTESHRLYKQYGRALFHIDPDMIADFSALPFPSGQFSLVVFDPPHIRRNEALGFLTKKYGVLKGDWRIMLEKGFSECFRVLRHEGTLIFKWSDVDIPVSEILELAHEKPLFGNRCGKKAQTHWIVFIKNARDKEQPASAQHGKGDICPACSGSGAKRGHELSLQDCAMCGGSGKRSPVA